MATTQSYQQVVVAPAVAAQPLRSTFVRRGVKIGGLVLGLPCVVCLCLAGAILLISGIGALSVDTIDFDDDDNIGGDDDSSGTDDDDDDNDFEFDDDPLNVAGVAMLLIGIFIILISGGLCYIGKREYQKFMIGDSGRVINTAPTVSVPATLYPLSPNAACPGGAPGVATAGPNMASYPSYPNPSGGLVAQYPPAPPGNQMYQCAPAPSAGQMSYPAAPPVQMPYPGPAAGQMAPYPGQQPGQYAQQSYVSGQPYQAPGPPIQHMDAGLPSKSGVPGQVDFVEPYERPPPYAP